MRAKRTKPVDFSQLKRAGLQDLIEGQEWLLELLLAEVAVGIRSRAVSYPALLAAESMKKAAAELKEARAAQLLKV